MVFIFLGRQILYHGATWAAHCQILLSTYYVIDILNGLLLIVAQTFMALTMFQVFCLILT